MAHSFDVFDAAGTNACSCQSNGGLASNMIWARVRQVKYVGESSPEKICGREFAKKNVGESSPDKIIWARVRQIKLYCREFAR
jgi:hypothetical protein